MGFTDGWAAVERADTRLRGEANHRDRKGKGKQRDEGEDLDIKDRTRSLAFHGPNLKAVLGDIAKRVSFEEKEDETVDLVFRLTLDLSSLAYRRYKAAREAIRQDQRLSADSKHLCYRRLQLWITRSVCEEYKTAVPDGCEVELELHVDHDDARDVKKRAALEERYRGEAEKWARETITEVLDVQRKKKERTLAQRRKYRKEKKEKLKAAATSPGDAEFATEVAVAFQRTNERKRQEPILLKLPDKADFEHEDAVIKVLSIDILSRATLVSAQEEADDSIVARSQKPSTMNDRRIATGTPRVSVDGDGDVVLKDAVVASRGRRRVVVTVVASADCDYIYQLEPTETRFVISTFRRFKEDRVRAVDLLALREVDAKIWPFRNVQATCGAAVMVGLEKGPKVKGLAIRGLVKNERLLRFLHDIEAVGEALGALKVFATSPDNGEEEETVSMDVDSLEGPFESVSELNARVNSLFVRSGIKDGAPGPIEAFIGFVETMRREPLTDAGTISKRQVILKQAQDYAERAIAELAARLPSTESPRNHGPAANQRDRSSKEDNRIGRIKKHLPLSLPRSDPDDSSRRLDQYKVRHYRESFNLLDIVEKDLNTCANATDPAAAPRPRAVQHEKQKSVAHEAKSGKKRKKAKRAALAGTGIRLEGFGMRCIPGIPFESSSLNEIAFRVSSKDVTSSGRLVRREWSPKALWALKTIRTVGRESMFEMGQYLDDSMRTTIVLEPGCLHLFIESADGVPKLSQALLAVFQKLDVDDKTPSDKPPATVEQIAAFFERYDTGNGSIDRSLYSTPQERVLAQQALSNARVTDQELQLFGEVCDKNQMVCIGMVLVAKAIKSSLHTFAPVIDYSQFYGLAMTTVGTNVVVASRQYASNWSKSAARFVIANADRFPSILSTLPFAYSTNPTTLASSLTDPSQLDPAARAILRNLARNVDRKSEPNKSIAAALIEGFRSIDTRPGAPPPNFPALTRVLESTLGSSEAHPLDLLDPLWQPATIAEFDAGRAAAIAHLSEITSLVGRLAQRGISAQLEHVEAIEKATKKGQHKKGKKVSEWLKEIASIGGYEDSTLEGEKAVLDTEEEDEMEGTVCGGAGAKEFRLFARSWDSAFGRDAISFNPQGTRLNVQLLAYFVRDPTRGSSKRPLIDYLEKSIARKATAVDQMNAIDAHPPFARAPPMQAEARSISDESRRATETAARFVGHPHQAKTEKGGGGGGDGRTQERTGPRSLRSTSQGGAASVSFREFSALHHLERSKQDASYAPQILLPGLHNSGVVDIGPGSNDCKIAPVTLNESLLAELDQACGEMYQAFKAVYPPQTTWTELERLLPQNAHDHLGTIFSIKIGARLFHNMLYLKEDEIQLFYMDPRRTSSTGIRLLAKYGVSTRLPWTLAIPRLLSHKRKCYVKTKVRDEDPESAYDKKKLANPDLYTALEVADFSKLAIRRTLDRSSYGERRAAEKRKLHAMEDDRRIYSDQHGHEYMWQEPTPVFHVQENRIEWKNKEFWLRGRRQKPIRFDDSDPLVLPTYEIPNAASATSRPVRALNAAQRAMGRLPKVGRPHTVVSVDPGIAYPLAAVAQVLGTQESTFLSVGAAGLHEEKKRAARIRTELGKLGLPAQIERAYNARDSENVATLFSRSRPSLPYPSSSTPLQTVLAPPLSFSGPSNLYPVDASPYLNSSVTRVPPPLIGTIFSLHPTELSAFNFQNQRRQRARRQSQAALAVQRAVPRQARKGEGKGWRKQSVALLLGSGEGKNKSWGMGENAQIVKFFAFALRARVDLCDLDFLMVCEDYTSQVCPCCRWPLVYAVDSTVLEYKPILRILQCVNCGINLHRDKVGATNLVANLFNFAVLKKNIRAPEYSIELGNGQRLSRGKPMDKITRAWWDLRKKLEKEEDASRANSNSEKKKTKKKKKSERELFQKMIKTMESVWQRKKEAGAAEEDEEQDSEEGQDSDEEEDTDEDGEEESSDEGSSTEENEEESSGEGEEEEEEQDGYGGEEAEEDETMAE